MDDIGFYFKYQDRIYQLPVNPEELQVSYPGNNQSKIIVGLSEVNLLQKPKLETLTIETWCPEQPWYPNLRTGGEFLPAVVYDELFRGVFDSETYMRLIVTGLNINMLVAIENYDSWHEAGDHENLYFTLKLKKYIVTNAVQVPITSENVAITVRNTFSLGSGGTGSSGTFVSHPTQITVGSPVLVTGQLHVASTAQDFDIYIGNTDKMLLKYSGRVSHIAEGADYPYHIVDTEGNWLGWASADSVSLNT